MNDELEQGLLFNLLHFREYERVLKEDTWDYVEQFKVRRGHKL
jgi:hypothetical protein